MNIPIYIKKKDVRRRDARAAREKTSLLVWARLFLKNSLYSMELYIIQEYTHAARVVVASANFQI